MSAELDKIVESITELVLQELAQVAQSAHQEPDCDGDRQPEGPVPRVLVCQASKTALSSLEVVRQSGHCRFRFVESKACTEVPDGQGGGGYDAVIVLGPDLSDLADLVNLGAGCRPAAGFAVSALSKGVPVFWENGVYEELRRHSARLSSGFVRRFEDLYRMASGFGVEMGGEPQLEGFLQGLGRGKVLAPSRSQGRAVVTVEDVAAVRSSGSKVLNLAIGTIVTPLARQRADEWGIEVKFQ